MWRTVASHRSGILDDDSLDRIAYDNLVLVDSAVAACVQGVKEHPCEVRFSSTLPRLRMRLSATLSAWNRSDNLSLLLRIAPIVLSTCALASLLILGAWMLSTTSAAKRECIEAFNECVDDELDQLGSGAVLTQATRAKCAQGSDIEGLPGGVALACDMSVARPVLGMPLWRWLLFFGLYFPLVMAARAVAWAVSPIGVWCAHKNGRKGLLWMAPARNRFARFVRDLAWLGVWFALAQTPRRWADLAPDLEEAVGHPVWTSDFKTLHFVVWRLLVLKALLSLTGLLATMTGRVLSSALSCPVNDHTWIDSACVPTTGCLRASRRMRVLRGIDRTHWCAAQYARQVYVDSPGQNRFSERTRRTARTVYETIRSVLACRNDQGAVLPPLNAIDIRIDGGASPSSGRSISDSSADEIPPDDALDEPELLVRAYRRFFASSWHARDRSSLRSLMQTLREENRAISGPCDGRVADHGVITEVENVVWALSALILVFVAVTLFNPQSLSRIWTVASAVLITLSFVFGNSVRQLYENCVFLFSRHPFRSGDVVHVDGVKYLVISLHLRCVVVVRDDGYRINVPMHELHGAQIVNETRSRTLWDKAEWDADPSTTLEQCECVADRVREAIDANPSVLCGQFCVNLISSPNPGNKVTIRVWFTHAHAAVQDMLKRDALSYVVDAACHGMDDAGVRYTATTLVEMK